MKIINTIFEYRDQPVPQYSAIYDSNTKEIDFIPLYYRGMKTVVKDVRNGLLKIAEAIEDGAIINDAISHILEFRKYGITIPILSKIYETRQICENKLESIDQVKKQLVNNLIKTPKEIAPWMLVKGRSAIIYTELASRGIMWGPYSEHPAYNTNTLTGRSRTPGFNIQGTTENDPIRHIDPSRDWFICFDWVSADIRVAGYLSNDKFINNSFINSDPYIEIEKIIGTEDITRDDCKLEVLQSIYSVNTDNPIFDLMPELRSFILKKKEEFNSGVCLKTILGMPIPSTEIKSSLSGVIQGSIAEAIQNILIKIAERGSSDCILTEIHDSLIISTSEKSMKRTIEDVAGLMVKPFDDVGITFPVKVSVGKKWKQWKRYKVYR